MRERTDPTKIAMLRTFPALGSVSDAALAPFAAALDVVDVAAGQHLTLQGRGGRSVYFVLAGNAVAERDGSPVATIAAGDVVGEVAVLTGAAQNATVQAVTPMRVLVAGPSAVGDLLTAIASVADAVAPARSPLTPARGRRSWRPHAASA